MNETTERVRNGLQTFGKSPESLCCQKDKGWEIDPKTGKSKQLYTVVGYYPTRKEALTALAEYNKDPFDLRHATITFEEVYERWSEIHFEKLKTRTVIKLLSIHQKTFGK